MEKLRLLVQPIGEVPSEVLEHIAREIPTYLSFVDAEISRKSVGIPKGAFNQYRGQYLSTHILNMLKKLFEEFDVDKILGVCDVDLYVPRLNFVFGEAEMRGRVALISIRRLRQEFYGFPPDDDLLKLRALKEALHEIGHTLGLEHCFNPGCVMYFSNTIHDTDAKGPGFCDECLAKLAKML